MPDTHPDTPRLALEDAPPTPAVQSAVAAALDAGGLVALPGECAYLVVGRADHGAALERLVSAAGGDVHERPARLVADPSGLERLASADATPFPLAPLARRLAGRYWPGPLTLELEVVDPAAPGLAANGWTRFAAVAHRGTAGLVATSARPLAAREALAADGAPLVDADAVARTLGGLALVVDGGRSRIGERSALLALGRGRFELLRAGLLDVSELRSAAGLSIGFVCTGNTCRSPMAAALAKAELTRRLGSPRLEDFGFRVVSAGVSAGSGSPAAAHAVEVLAGRRIDLADHRSRPAIPEEIARLDRVYGLTRAHLEALVLGLPPGRAAHLELLDPEGLDVPDPVGGTRADYEECAARLDAAIAARAADWA